LILLGSAFVLPDRREGEKVGSDERGQGGKLQVLEGWIAAGTRGNWTRVDSATNDVRGREGVKLRDQNEEEERRGKGVGSGVEK